MKTLDDYKKLYPEFFKKQEEAIQYIRKKLAEIEREKVKHNGKPTK